MCRRASIAYHGLRSDQDEIKIEKQVSCVSVDSQSMDHLCQEDPVLYLFLSVTSLNRVLHHS